MNLNLKAAYRNMFLLFILVGLFMGSAASAFAGMKLTDINSSENVNADAAKILIAYDTKHGSTVAVVDKIGDVLTADGFQVDKKLVWSITDISEYSVVILGSPVYWSTLLPGALQFLEQYKSILAAKTFAIFVLSTNVDPATDLVFENSADYFVTPVMEQYPEIDPIGTVGLLPGKIDFSEVFPMEFITLKLAGYDVVGDLRNYAVVTTWAQEISDLIK